MLLLTPNAYFRKAIVSFELIHSSSLLCDNRIYKLHFELLFNTVISRAK